MKNFSDPIGNRTRDLPACSAVPQTRCHFIPQYNLAVINSPVQICTSGKNLRNGHVGGLSKTQLIRYTDCPGGKCARFRENVPSVKIHRYNQKHLYPKLNGYGDKGEWKVWSSCGSTCCTWFAWRITLHCACPSLSTAGSSALHAATAHVKCLEP